MYNFVFECRRYELAILLHNIQIQIDIIEETIKKLIREITHLKGLKKQPSDRPLD